MSGTTRIYQKQIINSEIMTRQVLLTEITSFYNNDLSEDLFQYAVNRMWHLESECGAIFEIEGIDLNNKFLQRLKEVDKNINEKSFNDDDFYTVEISY